MLLSSKNDESDGHKTLEFYSSYITSSSKQKRLLIRVLCYGLYCRKSVTFWNEGTFSLTSSVQEVHVIFKWNNLQSLGKVLLHFKKHEFCIPYVSLSDVRWPIRTWFYTSDDFPFFSEAFINIDEYAY